MEKFMPEILLTVFGHKELDEKSFKYAKKGILEKL